MTRKDEDIRILRGRRRLTFKTSTEDKYYTFETNLKDKGARERENLEVTQLARSFVNTLFDKLAITGV